jgi:hypothetical protein
MKLGFFSRGEPKWRPSGDNRVISLAFSTILAPLFGAILPMKNAQDRTRTCKPFGNGF